MKDSSKTTPDPSFSGGELNTCSGRCFYKETGIKCMACKPFTYGRKSGDSYYQITRVAFRVLFGEKVAIAGLKDPSRHLEYIERMGIKAVAELMTYRNLDGEVIESGYVFYLEQKNTQRTQS